MILELKSPLPLETPKGKAFAYFLIDYGVDHDLIWVCFQNDTRECWSWSNKDVKIQYNITLRGNNGLV